MVKLTGFDLLLATGIADEAFGQFGGAAVRAGRGSFLESRLLLCHTMQRPEPQYQLRAVHSHHFSPGE